MYTYIHIPTYNCIYVRTDVIHTKKASCIYVQRTQRLSSSLCQGVMHVMVKHLDSNVKNGLRGAQKTGWASSYVTTPGKTSNKALEMVFFLMVGSMRKTCLNSTLGPKHLGWDYVPLKATNFLR